MVGLYGRHQRGNGEPVGTLENWTSSRQEPDSCTRGVGRIIVRLHGTLTNSDVVPDTSESFLRHREIPELSRDGTDVELT